MKLGKEYLTDEELEQLILDVEQKDLVAAPPDLVDDIMAGIDAASGMHSGNGEGAEYGRRPEQRGGSEHKVKEFRDYCFRVLTSVAAAVAIVFLLPGLADSRHQDVPARQEMVTPGKYATKEEAMNDVGILSQTLGNVTIFDDNDILKFFRERNGG